MLSGLSRFFLVATIFPALAAGDAGVLLEQGSSQSDPSRLSLAEMAVDVRIDDQTARVRIRQIFSSHVGAVTEGRWEFALPESAAVSDFAVWDGVTRIPGVILERRRAREIYEELRAQAIDPGLLQQGEGDGAEAARSTVFSARVSPILGYGFKRVEVEYHERIAVEDLRLYFAIPLRPEAYNAQTAGRLSVRLELNSSRGLADFSQRGDAFPLEVTERTPRRISARFDGTDVRFDEDLAVEWSLDPASSGALAVETYRDPNPAPAHISSWRAPDAAAQPGYFLASMLLPPQQSTAAVGPAPPGAGGPPRTVTALFDTSLSMQWDKLDRSYRALETVLLGLRPQDRLNLIAYDSEPRAFRPALVAASRDNVEAALTFVRALPIRGRTNLEAALTAGLEQTASGEGERYLVLIGDGGATGGTISNARLAARYAELRDALPEGRRPRTYVFAVGDEANLPLLRMLAANDGLLTHVRSTEPIGFKLAAFTSKIGRRPVEGLRLTADAVDMVYPLEPVRYSGSVASWAGRYPQPRPATTFRVQGADAETTVDLPGDDRENPGVARRWARARVDALLAQIDREGEDDDLIDEVIHWSKRFKFVTPYTSFLAAPRSLLRPRVIRPGDPILRVKADETVVSVTALFPFGLVKNLRRLEGEDVWQTRFLAPKDTPDGRHEVRLSMRDAQGRVFRETKTFLISSRPPTVRARLEKLRFRRGETVELRASATRTTRTLTARMYGVPPAALRWNPAEKLNTGSLRIPNDLPPGDYTLRFTAEDFAHNIGVEEVQLAVLP